MSTAWNISSLKFFAFALFAAAAPLAQAAADPVEYKVELLLTVDVTGTITDAVVAKSSGIDAFDMQAIKQTYSWKLKPAQRDGQAIETKQKYTVTFGSESAPAPKP